MNAIFDTNALINGVDITKFNRVYLPIIVTEELDKLKISGNPEKEYKARQAIKKLKSADNVVYRLSCAKAMPLDFDYTKPDNKILNYASEICDIDKTAKLLTYDYNMLIKARALGIPCEEYSGEDKGEIYKGYKEVVLNDEELAEFYLNKQNNYGLNINEYLIIKDSENKVIDTFKWTKDGFKNLTTKSFKSTYFKETKPLDEIQMCAFDSLYNDNITCLFGKSGTGKTSLSLAYIMQNLKAQKFRKSYVVYSFETLKGNKTLGFLPGNKDDKILNSGLGNILATKFGDLQPIKALITEGKLEILPTSDLRGVEFGEEDVVFITEAQNTDPYTLKTLVQRCKLGCKIIVEGDMLEQTDIRANVNGMDRLIEVFQNTKYFSCVKLKSVYRSPIIEIADKM